MEEKAWLWLISKFKLLPQQTKIWTYQTDKNYSSGSSVSSWSILPSGGTKLLQEFTFTLSKPGTDPDRQDAPHPHEALVDPTDSFIVVPDLGADLVRVFSIDHATSKLTESTPFNAVPGSGPRHGTFLVSGDTTYFFLVTELGNTLTSYTVTYGKGTLTFNEVFTSGIFGTKPTPEGAAAAECLLSVSVSKQLHHSFRRTTKADHSSTSSPIRSSSSHPHATPPSFRSQISTPQTAPSSPPIRCSPGPSTPALVTSTSSRMLQRGASFHVSFP